jgi:hypothetical protein
MICIAKYTVSNAMHAIHLCVIALNMLETEVAPLPCTRTVHEERSNSADSVTNTQAGHTYDARREKATRTIHHTFAMHTSADESAVHLTLTNRKLKIPLHPSRKTNRYPEFDRSYIIYVYVYAYVFSRARAGYRLRDPFS